MIANKPVFAAALAFALPAAASAQMITAADPAAIAKLLQAEGYKAEVSKGDDGDPMINSASGGSRFVVFFYGCEKNEKCTSIQFFAGYERKGVTLEKINDWNTNKRFGRAYRAEDGDARIEMDVDLDFGGMPRPLFVDHLNVWTEVMGKFETHIGDE